MNFFWIRLAPLCLLLLLAGSSAAEPLSDVGGASDVAWPSATAESRPWTRWWWLGSAVDRENLTRLLAEYQQAGFGGVEICPLYGAKGHEEQFLPFLSPEWTAMLEHTLREAARLDLGIDLTTGTGWPFGGPNVGPEIASTKLLLKQVRLDTDEAFEWKPADGSLIVALAVAEDGRRIDVTRQSLRHAGWRGPTGRWQVYAIASRAPIQQVKRAAPGGVGNVLDPYSIEALDAYLARFDSPLASIQGVAPRAQFHDSFEYYEATWTDRFLDEFKSRRGYDLADQLPALFDDGVADTVARVKSDYRETLSDLHRAFVERWTEWCHAHGSLSRNQAHGAPADLIDIYAAADIPETEIFGKLDPRQYPMLKFATSAAHLQGRTLVSAESFTWLGEHFQVPLSQLKPAADFLFLCGINQLVYHGVPYSPAEAPWPGWQFYAAVNFSPNGGLWRDLPAFNAYVTRCQSMLQSGTPSNDLLLYFPVHDIWHSERDLIMPFTTEAQPRWLWPTTHYQLAMKLWDRGYTFDQASDQLLTGAKVEDGQTVLGGHHYRALVVPRCRLMPVETLRTLTELARAGATILFSEALPTDVPGWGNLEERRAEFGKLLDEAERRKLGSGQFVVGQAEVLLDGAKVPREPMTDLGIRFIRRTNADGYVYFLVNGDRPVDGWISLGRPVKSAVLMDPRFETHNGVAAVRSQDDAAEVYLQLGPGESCILKTFTERQAQGPTWSYLNSAGDPEPIEGTWKVEFVDGGPELPASFEAAELASWTLRDDAEAQRFGGTARYTIEFTLEATPADKWRLDLGQVCESARVKINGQEVGTLWCKPFQVEVGQFLRPGKNVLEIEVTNLAANRIRDLDRRGVNWKYFYDINFVNRDYRPFDASQWPLKESGLLGPVTLEPMQYIHPQ